ILRGRDSGRVEKERRLGDGPHRPASRLPLSVARCQPRPTALPYRACSRYKPSRNSMREHLPQSMSRLIAIIERRPQAAFAGFLALHVVLWTALPALLYPNLPLDLIEALTYGREWQLGYDKLPPLPWWLVEIVYRLFGADTAYYAASEVVVIATFALVFATARPLVGAAGALVAVLIIDGLHYFNYTAPKFNHNVIQLPVWALAGFAFRSGLRHGRVTDWLLLGFALGVAVWA